MILEQNDISNILLNNPSKGLIAQGRKYNTTMRLHLYGEGMDTHLTEIKGFETPVLRELRIKYARNNKDLMARLMRPIDKVFSARGGSIYYKMSETQDKAAMAYASSIKGGKNVKEWVKDYWKPHFIDDPYGIIFMEIDPVGNVYPTYKSITTIYDYQPNGVSLEYVVFEVSKAEKAKAGLKPDDKIFRVVDDANDYWIQQDGKTITILSQFTHPNHFGRVPGMINSDIIDPSKDGFLSLFDDVITLADEYLLTGSVRTTHKFWHGFPKYWEYADTCPACNGEKTVEGETCRECKGTGKNIMTKVSDAKLINYPQDKDTPTITPNVAGYVEPSEIYHNISTSDLSALEDTMNFTVWGKSTQRDMPQVQVGNKTATQVLDEVKPEESRLSPISESAEKRHKFILDSLVEVNVKKGYIEAGGSSVNYGRRYMLEPSDSLLQKYNDAKSKGVDTDVLDDLLRDYYETEYSGDNGKLSVKIKKMNVQPYVHMTIAQVEASFSIAPEDKAAKAYYSEWKRTINDAMWTLIAADVLKQQLYDYAKTKAVAPKPINQAA
jgi:hypothetical protein